MQRKQFEVGTPDAFAIFTLKLNGLAGIGHGKRNGLSFIGGDCPISCRPP
jgi:hypothetical protein